MPRSALVRSAKINSTIFDLSGCFSLGLILHLGDSFNRNCINMLRMGWPASWHCCRLYSPSKRSRQLHRSSWPQAHQISGPNRPSAPAAKGFSQSFNGDCLQAQSRLAGDLANAGRSRADSAMASASRKTAVRCATSADIPSLVVEQRRINSRANAASFSWLFVNGNKYSAICSRPSATAIARAMDSEAFEPRLAAAIAAP